MPNCSVLVCRNRSDVKNFEKFGITYHRYPRDKAIKEQWIQAAGRSPDWWPTTYCSICSLHFEDKCFRPNQKRRILYSWAVPTLRLRVVFVTDHPNTAPALPDVTQPNSSGLNSLNKEADDDVDSLASDPDVKSEIVISENELVNEDEPPPQRLKMLDIAKKIDKLTNIVTSWNPNDESAIFTRHIWSQLQKMSTETRTLCQLNIQKLISEALLGEVRGTPRMVVEVSSEAIKQEPPTDDLFS